MIVLGFVLLVLTLLLGWPALVLWLAIALIVLGAVLNVRVGQAGGGRYWY